MIKVGFFQKEQLGIGQKLDFRALFSEIQNYIGLFSSLEHDLTSAPIAQLVACLTFFL